jgi:hypothetical protein
MSCSMTDGGQNPQRNGKDIRIPHGSVISTSRFPDGWVRHHYTQWIEGIGDAHPSCCEVGLEYRYWVQYDLKLKPWEIVVPEMVGRGDIYEPPEGYAMKKHDGNIVFFIDFEANPNI